MHSRLVVRCALVVLLLFATPATWQIADVQAAVTPTGDTTIGATTVIVGGNSFGSLTVDDTSSLLSNTTIVGANPSGFGTLTVDNAVYQNNGQTVIGDNGVGALRVRNQGVYTTSNLIAADDGAATITVEGEGSLLQVTQNAFELGRGGNAQLNVLDKATVMSSELFAAYSNITIDGGALLAAPLVALGPGAILDLIDGRLNVDDLAISGGGNASQVNAAALARVSGPNARVDAFSVGVGVAGEGTLRISDGGQVNTSSGSTFYVGRNTASAGRVFIDGPDSRLSVAGEMVLGENGFGQLTITGGAIHQARQVVVGGNNGFGDGLVEVRGAGARLTVVETLALNFGGEVHVDQGATISAKRAAISGLLTVEQATIDAREQGFDINGRLSGRGRLVGGVAVGGELRATGGELRISGVLNTFNAGPTVNPLIVIDNGSLVVEGSSRIETNTEVRLTDGILDVRSRMSQPAPLWVLGDLVVTPGSSQVFGSIRAEFQSEFTHAPGSDTIYYDDFDNLGTFLVAEGAVVTVLGEFSGNGADGGGLVRLEGGVSPGFSPGLMAFGGDAELGAQSVTELEIEGLIPGQGFDQITVDGSISLDGALNLHVLSSLPGAGGSASLTIIDAESISGEFSHTPAFGQEIGAGWRFGGLDYDTAGGDVILNLVAGLEGDFNNDGAVDAADYTVWRDNLGAEAGTLANDFTGLPVGPEQYAIWRSNYGQSFGLAAGESTVAPAPEPSAAALLLAIVAIGFRVRTASRFEFVRR